MQLARSDLRQQSRQPAKVMPAPSAAATPTRHCRRRELALQNPASLAQIKPAVIPQIAKKADRAWASAKQDPRTEYGDDRVNKEIVIAIPAGILPIAK